MTAPVPIPEDLRARLARAILCVARGDRELTPAESIEFERRVREMGGDDAIVEAALRDPDSFPVEPLLDAKTRAFGVRILHDALSVARADGITDRERKVAARAAVQLQVAPAVVPALRALLDVEEALRRAADAPVPDPASPAGQALAALQAGADAARSALRLA